jgi:hypothetical protein
MAKEVNVPIYLGGLEDLSDQTQDEILINPPLRPGTISGLQVVKTDEGAEICYLIVPVTRLGHC